MAKNSEFLRVFHTRSSRLGPPGQLGHGENSGKREETEVKALAWPTYFLQASEVPAWTFLIIIILSHLVKPFEIFDF